MAQKLGAVMKWLRGALICLRALPGGGAVAQERADTLPEPIHPHRRIAIVDEEELLPAANFAQREMHFLGAEVVGVLDNLDQA